MKKIFKKGFRKTKKSNKGSNKGNNKKRIDFRIKPNSIRGQLTVAITSLLLLFTIIIAAATSFITSKPSQVMQKIV